jgi:hypothetical protein
MRSMLLNSFPTNEASHFKKKRPVNYKRAFNEYRNNANSKIRETAAAASMLQYSSA